MLLSLTSSGLKSSGGVDSIQSNFTSTISSNHTEANPQSMKTSNTDDGNVSIGNDSGKDPSNSSNVNIEDQQTLIEKISPQKYPDEEAKLAQQLAQQHLMNHNNIENKLVKTQQPGHDKKEKDKTIESTTPNESTNDVTRNSLGGTGSENRQIIPDRTSQLPSQFEAVTPQHHTLLSLRLIPSKTEGTYTLTGMLWDKTAGKPLPGREIFLSADPPIKIPSQFTNKAGHFDINKVNVLYNVK